MERLETFKSSNGWSQAHILDCDCRRCICQRGWEVLPSHWNAEHTLSDVATQGGLDVVSNALSNETSNRISADAVLAQAISVVSNAVSLVSARADVISNALSNETSNRASADAVLSAAVTVVSNAASNALSVANAASNKGSVLSVNLASVDSRLSGLSDAHTSLVNRVSANSGVGGGGSVTSTELSAVSAAAASADTTLSVRLDSVVNRVSANSGVGGGGSVTSTELSAAIASEVSNRNSAINVVSVAVAVVSASHTSLAASVAGALSAITTNSAQMTSADNAISQAVSIVSVAAANALSVANAASQKGSVLLSQSSLGRHQSFWTIRRSHVPRKPSLRKQRDRWGSISYEHGVERSNSDTLASDRQRIRCCCEQCLGCFKRSFSSFKCSFDSRSSRFSGFCGGGSSSESSNSYRLEHSIHERISPCGYQWTGPYGSR